MIGLYRYDHDNYFPVTPSCKRAVHEAVAILESLGHEVVKFELPNIRQIIDVYFDHMLGDAGITSLEIWEGEILDQVRCLGFLVSKLTTIPIAL